jgi:hypothetical protein
VNNVIDSSLARINGGGTTLSALEAALQHITTSSTQKDYRLAAAANVRNPAGLAESVVPTLAMHLYALNGLRALKIHA